MLQKNTPKQILIIDDNVTNIKVAMAELAAHGLEIIIARNGETGLERAAYAQPDLILLDVQMPGIDGFETCRRLKANETTRDIPVIFMTALSDVANKVRGFEAGGVDYVTKPIQPAEVWARVNTHLIIRDLQLEMSERITELDAFAHTVAHDLKNPLSRIILGMELLQEKLADVVDAESEQIMAISVNGGRQMVGIIDELLLLASVRQGEVQTEPVEMLPVFLNARERLTHMIEEYQADIIFPESWPVAIGYAPWLEEVWANYLSNGLKYGGRPPRLQVGGEAAANGMVRFWVQDNGEGLTAVEQAKLFQEFSRAHDQSTKGHGLGLSIVQRIIARLGGEVGLESEVGRGSRFYFTLPATRQVADIEGERGGEKRPFSPQILIADDNKTNQQLLIIGLTQLGCTVDAVSNGQEALAVLSQKSYDFVFMDVEMPVMDGLEATRQLRQRPDIEPQPTVIAYTANADKAQQQRCREAGMDGFVSKPIDIDDLATILAQHKTPDLPIVSAEIDLEAKAINNLRRTVGDDPESITLLIDTALEDISNQLFNLQESVKVQDAADIYMAAHSLKSLGNNFGATAFAALSRDIELAAKAGDIADVQAMIPRLLQAVEPMVAAMVLWKAEVNI